MSEQNNEVGFLSRWMMRKNAALQAEKDAFVEQKTGEGQKLFTEKPSPPQIIDSSLPISGETNEAITNNEAPHSSGAAEITPPILPDIETLDHNSDFSGFLHKSVPESLKNAALRKLWLSDPLLAGPDVLADYAWDFNQPSPFNGWNMDVADMDPSALIDTMKGLNNKENILIKNEEIARIQLDEPRCCSPEITNHPPRRKFGYRKERRDSKTRKCANGARLKPTR